MKGLLDRWRRRHWRSDPVALARVGAGAPATVITGASKGIGRALADSFARDGNRLVLVARQPGPLEDAAREIHALGVAKPLVVALDVAAEDAVGQLQSALADEGLYIDVLINCAGVGQAGLFAEADPERLDDVVALNSAALTRLMRAVLPDMLVRGRGGVLNIASLSGMLPGPGQATYYASKAYVISLTEAVAAESRGLGVRIAVAVPGPVDTRFHDRMGAKGALYRAIGLGMTAQTVARWVRFGYRSGLTVIAPGVVPLLAWPFARFVPHFVTLPLMKLLLMPRPGKGDRDAR